MGRHPEYQYLDLLEHLIEKGDRRIDRTGVGTLSTFGAMMRFDLSDGTFPSLLQENVKIWTDWPLEKFRKSTGTDISQADFEARILADDEFAAQWGELGPVYGKQWRRWVDANGKEHDQVATLIETLKKNPTS
ncbi:unnamed protein product, partial [Darwinula stevensoni]